MSENAKPAQQPPFGGASGSARQCDWLIGEGRLAALCPGKATHIDPLTGTLFCESHAEDYEDVFGAALQTLSPNAVHSKTNTTP